MQDVLKAKDVTSIGMRGYKEYIDYNWHGKVIKIRYLLSHDEFCQMIEEIKSMCTTADGSFIYEYLSFSIRLSIIASYAMVELPTDMDVVHRILYHSDLFDVVCKNANSSQIHDIILYFGLGSGFQWAL